MIIRLLAFAGLTIAPVTLPAPVAMAQSTGAVLAPSAGVPTTASAPARIATVNADGDPRRSCTDRRWQ